MQNVQNNQLVITRKMSGTGSVHDLASDQYDRVVLLNKRTQNIVILPAFYNAAPTLHNTFNGALREVKKLVRQGYAPTVIDRAGDTLILSWSPQPNSPKRKQKN
jgi:hypothetical protein